MPEHWVTRDEHMAAIARLDAADALLRENMTQLERIMRTDYEEKIADAVGSLERQAAENLKDLKGDISEVKKTLRWQNRVWIVPGVSTLFMGFLYLFLHYTFHIG